jgi:hypothetical protein
MSKTADKLRKKVALVGQISRSILDLQVCMFFLREEARLKPCPTYIVNNRYQDRTVFCPYKG